MNLNSFTFKLTIGTAYLAIILTGLYFLFSVIDIKDLTSYEFIRVNKDVILKYKNENFLFLTTIFFIFCVVWVLLLGFAMPLLIFSWKVVGHINSFNCNNIGCFSIIYVGRFFLS